MANERLAAAYHEAGHFCRAIMAHGKAVVGTIIQPDEHGWGGITPVNKTLVPQGEMHLCCIAVAGFLAEAKGVAGNGVHSPPIAFSPELLDQLHRIIEGPLLEVLAWELQVPLAGGGTSPGRLTQPDVHEIPPGERTYAIVEQALITTIGFLNAKSDAIDIIAGYLASECELQNNSFFNWLIQKN